MGPESFTVLKGIFGGGAAVAGFLAAWFEFKDRGQTDEQRLSTRHKYGVRWKAIKSAGVLELPLRVIQQAFAAKSRFPGLLKRMSRGFPIIRLLPAVFYTVPIVSFAGGWMQFGGWFALALFGLTLSPAIWVYLEENTDHRVPDHPISSVLIMAGLAAWIVTGGLLVRLALTLPIAYASVVLVLATPLLTLLLSLGLLILNMFGAELMGREGSIDVWIILGIGTVFSLSTTMIALVVGHYASPAAFVPQTLQMILSNVVCDGITLVATFAILGLAIREKRRWPIPLVIVFDLVVAAVLACASLYGGLIFTDEALSLRQVGYVLIGMSQETRQWEIGPYFWAMHTTFLPTLLYLGLILFTWVGKLIVLPVASIFRKGEEIEKPHHYTAGALFLIAAALFALSWFIGFMEPKPASRAYRPNHNQLEWRSHIPTPAIHFEVIAPDSRVKTLLW